MAVALQGIVTSDKRDKTITVSITSRETHPLYRKQYSHTRKYTAHDEKNEARDSENMSPYTSESFDGYSYSKGGNSKGGTATSWQSQFADRLKPYRRLYVI